MTQNGLRLVDRDMMDKGKALDAALSQIERAFGKGSIMRMGAHAGDEQIAVISSDRPKNAELTSCMTLAEMATSCSTMSRQRSVATASAA